MSATKPNKPGVGSTQPTKSKVAQVRTNSNFCNVVSHERRLRPKKFIRLRRTASLIEKETREDNDMMSPDELDTTGQQFLIQLFEQTKGDSAVQVSMYDIGEKLGLDRDIASTVAQELIGSMLVEIRTLSGGIGISADGSQMVQKLIGPAAASTDEFAKLDDTPLLNASGRQAVEQIVSELKNQAGSLGLDFDTLAELMADLKTIDAQLGSSRPKTAIIRECLFSVLAVLKNSGDNKTAGRIRTLVGS